MKAILLLALLLPPLSVVVANAAVPATGPTVPALSGLDRDIPALLSKHKVPGAAVAVALDGRIVFVRGYGYADQEAERPVQPDTRFRTASLAKPITAALTLKLVEQGRLSLDDRAFQLLGYPTPTYAGARRDTRLDAITVRQLLNHTAGWDRDRAVPPFPAYGAWEPTYCQAQIAEIMGTPSPATPEVVARYMVGQPLQTAPGAAYAYSNVGYLILGRLIELKTGLTYEKAAQEFLAAAGVSGAAIAASPRGQLPADEAVAYDPPGTMLLPSVFGEGQVARPYSASVRTLDAHGGWAISAPEYLRFLLALDGVGGGPSLLQPSSVAAMRTEQPAATGYGYGWVTRFQPYGGGGHNGDLPGTFTMAVRSDDGRVEWVFFGNSCPSDATGMLVNTVIMNDLMGAMHAAEVALRAASKPDAEFAATTLGWAAWVQAHALVAGATGGAAAASLENSDADNDAVPNLIEYAAGLDPRRCDAMPAASFSLATDGTPQFTFRRLILEHALAWQVETSADGARWNSVAMKPLRTLLNSDGTLSVTLALPGAKKARLRVTRNATGTTAALELALADAPTARLVNLSTRARAAQGDDALIVGFVVDGTQPRTLLVRGIGPALSHYGVTDVLGNPGLRLFAADGRTMATNDDWTGNVGALAAVSSSCGAFALDDGSADAAMVVTVQPGAYTAQLSGPTGSSGNALVEIYEADRGASRAINLSCRSRVGGTSGDLTAGFVIAGDGPRTVLLRAVGPGLRSFGVNQALADPTLTVTREGVTLARNSGWTAGGPAASQVIVAAAERSGAFPLAAGSADAALLLTLQPGAYTMQIAPAGTSSGVVLAEVYDVP